MQLISHDRTEDGFVGEVKRNGFSRPVTYTCFEFLIKARPALDSQLEHLIGELVETLAPMQGVSWHFGAISQAQHLWQLDVLVKQGSSLAHTLSEALLNRLIHQMAIQSMDVRRYTCNGQPALRIAG